jgi:hypothetical protein
MKFPLITIASLGAALVAAPAFADPPAPAAPPTVQVPEHTFVVRLDKPQVLVDIKRPTAASAAGAAHDALRASMMRLYEPATLHPAR